MFYSKSTGGFYDLTIHGAAIPADVVEITEREHALLMVEQSAGKVIVADANGNPIAVDPISLMTLSEVQATQATKVSAACATALTTGFTSSSLGVALTYPSQDNDQRNLQSAVSATATASPGWTIPLWCTDGDHWSFTSHTAAQVQQVNADWLAHRVAAQQKYADLIAKINAATSIEEVQAIHW